jgi:hypothetical protein
MLLSNGHEPSTSILYNLTLYNLLWVVLEILKGCCVHMGESNCLYVWWMYSQVVEGCLWASVTIFF